MTMSREPIHRCAHACLGILLLLAIGGVAWPQPAADFSGQWKQDNERCQPKRRGDSTLRIGQSSAELTVETTIVSDAGKARHAVQKYTLDGQVSVATGADGDEFHTAVAWKGSSLVFSIEEHEDGRILYSTETWSLIENGAALQRVREHADGGAKQTLLYRREGP